MRKYTKIYDNNLQLMYYLPFSALFDDRVFLPLWLILASVSMNFMPVPSQWTGAEHKGPAILVMGLTYKEEPYPVKKN